MALVEPAAPRSSRARSDRRPEPQPRTTAQVAQMAEVSPEDELDAMLKAEGVAEAVPPEKAAAAGGKVELSGDSQKLRLLFVHGGAAATTGASFHATFTRASAP